LTFRHRPPNTCRFCAHENAADSKYCSECGEPLRLIPCPRCGAVNDVRMNVCYQCQQQLSGCTTDDIAPPLSASKDVTPSSGQCSQESDEATIFAEIKQLYDGVLPNLTDNFKRPALISDVDRPDDIAPPLSASNDVTPSSGQCPQESDEAAIFAEIKQLYDGVLPNLTDNFNPPALISDVDRPDDIAPPLSASKDFTPSSNQRIQESDEAATRRKIKELYYSNLRRRTARYDRASLAAESDTPKGPAPQLPAAEGDSIFRRGFSQTIIGIAILAVIVVLGYYQYHQRFLGDTLRSLVIKREQSGNEGPAGARAVRRDMATLKTIPAQNTQHARTEQKTVVWVAQKINRFWKGVLGKIANGWAIPVAKTPELAAAPAPEPVAAPASKPAAAPTSTPATAPAPENEAANASKPAGVPAPEPAPKVTTDAKRAAPTAVKSATVPALPARKETASVPTSAFEGELESASAPAIVSFAIAPWGEIYVDGQRRGVNPPMRELELSPGKYEVEVRNTTFPAHVQTIKVEPGTHIRIKHHFR